MSGKIVATQSYLPRNIIKNSHFEDKIDTTDTWISTMTGIKQRHFASDMSLLDMVIKCINQFDSSQKEGIDAIIIATMSYENKSPSLSSLLAKEIGSNCFCIDINAACSGYVYGLHLANSLLSNGHRKVLVIGAEKMSNIIDFTDRNTCILFGDGVGATILETDNRKHFSSPIFASDSNIMDLNVLENQKLKMKGQNVFKFAVTTLYKILDQIELDSIDYFIFHQANIRIIETVIKKYNLQSDKVLTNLENYGNTSSASIPILLSEHEFKHGDRVLMVGFGAGLSYGSIIYDF